MGPLLQLRFPCPLGVCPSVSALGRGTPVSWNGDSPAPPHLHCSVSGRENQWVSLGGLACSSGTLRQ